jgi:hypothetical protein
MKRPSHEGSDTEGQGKAEIDVAANHDDFLLLRSRPFSLINVSAAFRVMGIAFRAYLRRDHTPAAAQSDFRPRRSRPTRVTPTSAGASL